MRKRRSEALPKTCRRAEDALPFIPPCTSTRRQLRRAGSTATEMHNRWHARPSTALASCPSRPVVVPEPVKLDETSGGWFSLTGLLGLDGGAGLVDPHLGGQGRRLRVAGGTGRGGRRRRRRGPAGGGPGWPGGAVVDGGGGVQPDPGMAVLVVVVGEEQVAECACVVQGGERAGEDGAVLEGLECRLGEWVVVGDVRAGMAAGDVQVGQQRRRRSWRSSRCRYRRGCVAVSRRR